VIEASAPLPPEKRALLLERIAAKLALHGPGFTDADVDKPITSAMAGLNHDQKSA
jgi:hypothetical protein